MAATGITICEVGLPQSVLKINKTSRLINMAFDMMKFIDNVTYGKNEKIVMKNGIHTGQVIAGVIGYHKPQFSLIGDTVNTTSRVCSTGDKGNITLSNEAMLEGRSCDLYFAKKIVSAKGKGDLITYQVKKRGVNESVLKSLVSSMINSKAPMSPGKKSYFGNISNAHASNISNTNASISNAGVGLSNVMMKVASAFQDSNNSRAGFNSTTRENAIKLIDVNEPDQKLIKHETLNKSLADQSMFKKDFEDESDDEGVMDSTTMHKIMYASKYLLRTPRSQDQLYNEFLAKQCRDSHKLHKMRILMLNIAYLIRTLLLISLKNFYSNITIVFLLRGVFVFCNFISMYLMRRVISLDTKARITKSAVMGFFFLGIVASLTEIFCSLIYEDYSMSFLEIVLNYLIHSNI